MTVRVAFAGATALLFTCSALAQQASYPFRVDWVLNADKRGGALMARNDRPVAESVILRQTQAGENIRIDVGLPVVAVVPAKSSVRLVGLQQADEKKAWRGIAWQWSSYVGVVGAQHDPLASYRLPWPGGKGFVVIQAPGGRITTHDTPDSRDAIDFGLPEGTPVVAARSGVVADIETRFVSGRPDRALWDKANYVRVLHGDGTMGLYLHLKPGGAVVTPGERVEPGQLLGYSGNTGYSYEPHLHFAVLRLERQGDQLAQVTVPVKWVQGNPPVEIVLRRGMTVGVGAR